MKKVLLILSLFSMALNLAMEPKKRIILDADDESKKVKIEEPKHHLAQKVAGTDLSRLSVQKYMLPFFSDDEVKPFTKPTDTKLAILTIPWALEDEETHQEAPMPDEDDSTISDEQSKKQCASCGKFVAHLSDHMNFHTGERPYKCTYEECMRTFAQLNHLTSHLSIHKEERQFRCAYNGCLSIFRRAGDLKKHERIHSEEKPYKCTYESCTRTFAQSSNLKVHLRTHTREKPYKCTNSKCMKAFAHLGSLKKHVRSHTDEKIYICTESGCNRPFARASDLTRHHQTHKYEY